MKYIDIKTGEIYNGEYPYIHWFHGELSTDLIYTHSVCFISEYDNLHIKLDSDIFHIIDTEEDTTYDKAIKDEIDVYGKVLNSKYYIYIIYFAASSKVADQYMTEVIVSHKSTIVSKFMIGADFYGENESLYINLSNFGVELPQAIQKAIYSFDADEDNIDHILLNRKMKELLSNYWDIIANRGSYKSLINSLKWFEWGDLIRIREIWKHEDFGRVIYDDRDLCSVMEEKYNDSHMGFLKTTNISLYVALQKLGDEYDSEFNPLIENISSEWSRKDLMIKLCLLGKFYETYFMPIHLNLFQCTIENIVFTNTIKLMTGTCSGREDYLYNINEFDCNVKDNSTFELGNVKCIVNNDTFFGDGLIGVDTEVINSNNIDLYLKSRYDGVGCIVDFECSLPTDERIVESWCKVNDVLIKDYKPFNKEKSFHLLFKAEGRYIISLQFMTGTSCAYTKTIHINIVDANNIDIKLYKIMKGASTNYPSLSDFNFSRNITGDVVYQYIPISKDYNDKSGIGLNNILILKGNWRDDSIINKYYDILSTPDEWRDYIKYKNYTICISKSFWFDPFININNFEKIYKKYIYRNELGFFPSRHHLIEFGGDSVEDYKVYNDALVAIPNLKYSLPIEVCDWEFINTTTGKSHFIPKMQSPIVASSEQLLDKGYYDIVFRYKLGETVKEMRIDSAFIQS